MCYNNKRSDGTMRWLSMLGVVTAAQNFGKIES